MTKELTPEQIAAAGRELDTQRWRLPKKYRLQADLLALPPEELKKKDPEMYKIWERTKEEQARLAETAQLPFGTMSPQDAERARSVTIAENLRITLADLNRRIGTAAIAGEGDLDGLQESRLAVRHQLAERYAIFGRYDLAAEVEPDQTYRNEYIAILDAVWRDDEETCDCGDTRGSGEHADVTIPNVFVKQEVFSLKHGKVVSLVKCNKCPFMNVVETPEVIRQQRALRVTAQQLVGTLAPDEAARMLRARGHTTQELLTPKK